MTAVRLTLLAGAVAALGCAEPTTASMCEYVLSATPTTLFVGVTAVLAYSRVDSKSGQPCTGNQTGIDKKTLKFSVSDPQILTVTPAGHVIALSPGRASVGAFPGGVPTRQVVITVLAQNNAGR